MRAVTINCEFSLYGLKACWSKGKHFLTVAFILLALSATLRVISHILYSCFLTYFEDMGTEYTKDMAYAQCVCVCGGGGAPA